MKALGHAATILSAALLLALLICILYFAYGTIANYSTYSPPHYISVTYTEPTTIAYLPANATQNTTPAPGLYNLTQPAASYTSNQLIAYTLNLINTARSQAGLQNVTLSNTTSAQQHADSMLAYNYFSHWDPSGMKPYMRYTLLGGRGAVDENVAYEKYIAETCIGALCSVRQINVTQNITNMENNMLYNDSICCNNGHRYNILDSNHNQVSIGVAFNKTTVYLVEDFINNYIDWQRNTPSVAGYNVSLDGVSMPNTSLYAVQLTYEPLPTNMTTAQLNATSAYSEGQLVAGVVYGPYHYRNITNIRADYYNADGNTFDVRFGMSQLVGQYGPGVYTVYVYLNSTRLGPFPALDYSIFIGNDSKAYSP
jgi:uncharacterized protein YkwD